MAWQTVAEGVNITELRQLVADMELPEGSKMKVVITTPVPWVFDIAGAELAFKPFTPPGMLLKDVYAEGGKGYINLEADPVWLAAALAFIRVHWVAITIAGFVLTVIIAFIRIMVEVAIAPSPIPALAILAIAAIIILGGIGRAPPKKVIEES